MASASSRDRRVRLGKYQVLGHIATGGMGAVYKAMNMETGQEVALKVLPTELAARPEILERFRREAAHGIRLRHENIVSLYEFAEAQGTYFLAMEFVNGIDLFHHVKEQGPLDPALARDLLTQLARALDHAHQQGIVHRDIKPSNILLADSANGPVAKLADLGLARETRAEESRLTRAGTTLGTVDYLSPEQARDSGRADIRSDIYSLGCTFFHMVTGVPPFPEGTLAEKVYKHAETEPPDPRRLNARLPQNLAAICLRMLAKKPEQRYQTPADLLDELNGKESRAPAPEPKTEISLSSPVTQYVENADNQGEMSSRQAGDFHATDPTPANLGDCRTAAETFKLASRLITGGELASGIALLLECCQLDPTNIQFRQLLRDSQKRKSEAAGGPRWLERLRSLYPKLWLKTARKLHRPLRVLQYGEQVLTHNPADIGAQLDMAEAASLCGFSHLALWILERAKENCKRPVLIYRALALHFEQQEDYQQAMASWELVNKVNPGNTEAHHHLKDLAARDTILRGRYRDKVDARSSKPSKS